MPLHHLKSLLKFLCVSGRCIIMDLCAFWKVCTGLGWFLGLHQLVMGIHESVVRCAGVQYFHGDCLLVISCCKIIILIFVEETKT